MYVYFIFYWLLAAVIYKGPIKLLIVDIELRLMKYAVVSNWSLAFLYLLHTGMPVQI